MTTNRLTSLIAEAVRLDREKSSIDGRLKEIETLLKTEAETREDEHTATDGGGWSWTQEGNDGCAVRITQEGSKLKSSISAEKDVAKIKEISGGNFTSLFVPTITYKPVAEIRARAVSFLGGSLGNRLIKAITGKGRMTVSYETKEAA